MDVDEEAKSRRRMSVSSSTSSPLVRGPKGRDSIGDKLRELPKTLSLAVVRNAALVRWAAPGLGVFLTPFYRQANVTTPTVSIPDLELWTSAIATITELLGNRLDFEAGLSAREAWGAKLAGALTAVRDFVSLGGLAQDIAADLPVLCQALEFALDTNSGCMVRSARRLFCSWRLYLPTR